MYMVSFPIFIRQLLWAALPLTITHMGTTALALGAGWVRNVVEYRRLRIMQSPDETWWKKWWAERRQGIKLSTGIWFFLLLYCCFQAAYQQYNPVAEDNHNLRFQLSQLEDYRKNKEQYDRDLAWAKAEVRHWQDAYEREAKGETVPDRILSPEEESSLYDELHQTAKSAKNKDYATTYIGAVQDREAGRLWTQLDDIFRKSHWNVPLSSGVDKKVWTALSRSLPVQIVIYSDDMTKATFLMLALHNAAHLNSQVMPDSSLGIPDFKGTLVWIGYKQWP
jgi:hypothetical protein